jgi:hypothetical protein
MVDAVSDHGDVAHGDRRTPEIGGDLLWSVNGAQKPKPFNDIAFCGESFGYQDVNGVASRHNPRPESRGF